MKVNLIFIITLVIAISIVVFQRWNTMEGFSNEQPKVWGINRWGRAYKKNVDGSGGWQNMGGRERNVSASGKGWIWLTNIYNRIYKCRKPCNRGGWRRVGGSLKQVSGGEREVYGVNRWNRIFARPVNGGGRWRRIGGTLKNVSASGKGWIWGVNRWDNIFKCRKPCYGRWQRVGGRLKQVSGGKREVYGVNRGDYIYARPVNGRGRWRRIGGKLKWVSAANKKWVWGVNRNNYIYKCKKPCTGRWQRVGGRLKQISADPNEAEEPGKKIKFCPSKWYTEYNPAACRYPYNSYWCARTAKKGYQPDYKQCRTKFNVSYDNYQNDDFFKLIHEAYTLSTKSKSDGCRHANSPGYNIYRVDDQTLVKEKKECSGKEWWRGYKSSADSCAKACDNGNHKYFIYGNKRKDGYNRCKGNKCACYCEGPFKKQKYQNPHLSHMKSLMNKLFRTACMLEGNHDDYFDTKKCYSEYRDYTGPLFFDKVKKASEICKKDKNSDRFLCKRFKSLMKQLTDVSRIILGINNERLTGCYCTKALAAQGKCVPC